jgi:hypothetical protein
MLGIEPVAETCGVFVRLWDSWFPKSGNEALVNSAVQALYFLGKVRNVRAASVRQDGILSLPTSLHAGCPGLAPVRFTFRATEAASSSQGCSGLAPGRFTFRATEAASSSQGCSGLAPGRFTFRATYAVGRSPDRSNQRDTPRGKRVASEEESARSA